MDTIVGLDQTKFNLRNLAENQIMQVAATMLTNTAKSIVEAEVEHLKAVFDRPVPFTLQAVGFAAASATSLNASVFIKNTQAKYLAAQVVGGARAFKTFEEKFDGVPGVEYVMPGRGAKLNQHGNMSKDQLLQIAAGVKQRGHGSYVVKYVGGRAYSVHAKPKRGDAFGEALLFFTAAARYQPRFQFYETGTRTFEATYEHHFSDAWAAALAKVQA